MTVPQAVMVSGYHELTDRLAIMANVGWQDWSEFGKSDIKVRSETTTSFTSDRGFQASQPLTLILNPAIILQCFRNPGFGDSGK